MGSKPVMILALASAHNCAPYATHRESVPQMSSLLDLDRQLEPRANVITSEFDYRQYLNEMGMKWRREHNLPDLDPDEAGRLYVQDFPVVAMEYQFP